MPKAFKGALKLLNGDNGSRLDESLWETLMPTEGDLDLFVALRGDISRIPLRVTRGVDNEITIFDAQGDVVFKKEIKASESNGFSTWEELAVPADNGLYRIHLHPAGGRASGNFNFQTKKGVPLVMRDFLCPKHNTTPRIYFYVPHGLRKLALFLPHGDWNGVFHFQIQDADGAPAQIVYRDGRRTLEIEIPPGQDGRIWSFDHMVSPDFPPRLLNAPQAFSLSPETLMVPSDAF